MSGNKRGKLENLPGNKKGDKDPIPSKVKAFISAAALILQLIDILIRLWELVK